MSRKNSWSQTILPRKFPEVKKPYLEKSCSRKSLEKIPVAKNFQKKFLESKIVPRKFPEVKNPTGKNPAD